MWCPGSGDSEDPLLFGAYSFFGGFQDQEKNPALWNRNYFLRFGSYRTFEKL